MNLVGFRLRRRWSAEVVDLGIDFKDVSPFVLGKELGPLVVPALAILVNGAGNLSLGYGMKSMGPPEAWTLPGHLVLGERISQFRRAGIALASRRPRARPGS